MRLSKKQRIFSANVAMLITYAFSMGLELTFGEAFRPQEMQDIYYRRGQSQLRWGNHQRRLAVDFNVFKNDRLTYDFYDLKPLGDYWESLHPQNRWGGDWNKNDIPDGFLDTPHFEMNA